MNITKKKAFNSVKGESAFHIIRIRNLIIVLFAFLIFQFWLGMTINLEINMPIKHLGALESLIYYGGHFGFILVHIVNGFCILVVSLILFSESIKSSYTSLKIGSSVTLAAVVGAIVNGILFLESGQFFGWSVGMAMSAVSVLIAAAISLYFVGRNLPH
ncbi:MAG: hypothetical protein QW292_13010 [Candidatus Parvarchaeota archaeon]